MSENSIYSCLIYGCLIYFVYIYIYVLWKWDSKMCILMVILRVITINYSHRALINCSLHFFKNCYGELLGGGGWLYRPSPPPEILGGIYPPHPPPPGIDTHGGKRRSMSCQTADLVIYSPVVKIFPGYNKIAMKTLINEFYRLFNENYINI